MAATVLPLAGWPGVHLDTPKARTHGSEGAHPSTHTLTHPPTPTPTPIPTRARSGTCACKTGELHARVQWRGACACTQTTTLVRTHRLVMSEQTCHQYRTTVPFLARPWQTCGHASNGPKHNTHLDTLKHKLMNLQPSNKPARTMACVRQWCMT